MQETKVIPLTRGLLYGSFGGLYQKDLPVDDRDLLKFLVALFKTQKFINESISKFNEYEYLSCIAERNSLIQLSLDKMISRSIELTKRYICEVKGLKNEEELEQWWSSTRKTYDLCPMLLEIEREVNYFVTIYCKMDVVVPVEDEDL